MKTPHKFGSSFTSTFYSVRSLVVCISLFVVASCAHLSEGECSNLNWHAAGVTDAAEGTPSSEADKRLSACSEDLLQTALRQYDAGYQEGLAAYCTKANGFEVGMSGDEYLGVCPAIFEAEFLSGWKTGHALWAVRDELRHAEKKRMVAVISKLGPEVRDDRESREIESMQLTKKQRKQILDGTDGPHFGIGVGAWEYAHTTHVSKIDRLALKCVQVQRKAADLGFDVEGACD